MRDKVRKLSKESGPVQLEANNMLLAAENLLLKNTVQRLERRERCIRSVVENPIYKDDGVGKTVRPYLEGVVK